MTSRAAQTRTLAPHAALREGQGSLQAAYSPQQSGSALLRQRCRSMDSTLRKLWQTPSGTDASAADHLTLVAVGGYGRGTLFPGSDIDLLILTPSSDLTALQKHFIEAFLTRLWDLQMQVGHSVRGVEECLQEARQDLGIATTLLESRYLAGSR
ncbi:MAG TPA: nucleotidyltransferase domain-containing protein, partial [Acidithiobacillus sp.]|nr:nucleotidyltransferase domain-containing protein [Acidithiobacillus sp.]